MKEKIIAFDLDGVITKPVFCLPVELTVLVEKVFYFFLSWPFLHKLFNNFRKPNPVIVNLIHCLIQEGREVVVLSANPFSSKVIIKTWLEKTGLPVKLILKDRSKIPVHRWKWIVLQILDAILIDDNLQTVSFINRQSPGRAIFYQYNKSNK